MRKPVYFVTGNANKVREAALILDMPIEQIALDIAEVQTLDPRQLVMAKAKTALELHEPPLLVEDTSLVCEAMGRLPGPFIKYFEQELGRGGLYELLKDKGNLRAHALTAISFAVSRDEIHYFEGRVSGVLVSPRGRNGWGFDFIFQPDGETQTFAEMGADKKSTLSHRYRALQQLKAFLAKR